MPPPTTRTSKVRAVSAPRSRFMEHWQMRNSDYSLPVATIDDVRQYWERHIHDLEITTHAVGSRGFFDDLDQYHFEKLHHLLRLVDFNGWSGREVLEVGCGAGVDLARFAKGGALVTGVDITESAIAMARANFAQQGLTGHFEVADGEHLP